LNSRVPTTEVAHRAGRGVAVLLKFYAHSIDGDSRLRPPTSASTPSWRPRHRPESGPVKSESGPVKRETATASRFSEIPG
jgi:hypothetical protein